MRQSIVDLTHPLRPGDPHYATDPAMTVEDCCTLARDGFRVRRICIGSHQGTHVDAPAHFLEHGATIERTALDAFYGAARLLRIPRGAGADITLADLAPFDALIRPGARIIYQTGWDAHWREPDYFENPPSLTLDAVRFLVERKIRLLGFDTPNACREEKPAHELLLGAGIVLLENLTNLDRCPDAFTLCAFPLALEGSDGSPVRATAIIRE